VLIIAHSDKPERLQSSLCRRHGGKHLCHSAHGAGIGGKRDFNEVAFPERTSKPEQSPGG
jgi:hypothetical protein